MLLVRSLDSGPLRTGELRRRVDGISQKMLTQTLQELSSYGIVSRKSYHEVPPRVEYSLTPLGASLSQLLRHLEAWVVTNFDALSANLANPDSPEKE